MQPIAAATVIVLRQGEDLPEILLLHRHPGLAVQGDVWVFPGGRVESTDGPLDDTLRAARACVVREAEEEAGLRLMAADLAPISRWVTPEGLPRRFDTWFFMTAVDPSSPVQVDGREIVAHRWISAQSAIAAHHAGNMRLSPPGFILLSQLAAMGSLAHILTTVATGPPPHYQPRLIPLPDGACIVYNIDAAYHSGDLACAGRRQRLWIRATGWRYEEKAHPGR